MGQRADIRLTGQETHLSVPVIGKILQEEGIHGAVLHEIRPVHPLIACFGIDVDRCLQIGMRLYIYLCVAKRRGFFLDQPDQVIADPVSLDRICQIQLLKLGTALYKGKLRQPDASDKLTVFIQQDFIMPLIRFRQIKAAQMIEPFIEIDSAGDIQAVLFQIIADQGGKTGIVLRGKQLAA